MTSSTPIPGQPSAASVDELEREVARTADLVLKLACLVERYEQQAADARRLAVMRAAISRGGQALQRLSAADLPGADVRGRASGVAAG